jgi:hypothetical protein
VGAEVRGRSRRKAGTPRVARALVVATLLALAAIVANRPAEAGSPIIEPLTRSSPDSIDVRNPPSPAAAQRRSAYGTLVPLAVGAGMVALDVSTGGGGAVAAGGIIIGTVGVVAGPAAGYAYGGLRRRGSFGVGLRVALIVVPGLAAGIATRQDAGSEYDGLAMIAGMLVGTGLATISAVWDVATVRGAVERHNRALAPPVGARLEPAVAPFSHAPGFAVRIALGSGAR